MKPIYLTLLLTGCASTWQPFSDDAIGHAAAAAYESCMARQLLQTQVAEERCLRVAKIATQAQDTPKATAKED